VEAVLLLPVVPALNVILVTFLYPIPLLALVLHAKLRNSNPVMFVTVVVLLLAQQAPVVAVVLAARPVYSYVPLSVLLLANNHFPSLLKLALLELLTL